LTFDISGQLWLPSVSVGEKFFLVVEKLFVGHGRVLKVGSFNDGIDWACSLAKSTIDAFSHVDIVLGGPS
jgi:hypothetical protein